MSKGNDKFFQLERNDEFCRRIGREKVSRANMSKNFGEFVDQVEKLSCSEIENFCKFSVGFIGTRKM